MPDLRFTRFSCYLPVLFLAMFLVALLAIPAAAQSAYVRINQVGYEAANAPFRAYLMSTAAETGATFNVTNSEGATEFSGSAGTLLGTWSSSTTTYDVYPLDFTVPGGDIYTITVTGPVNATSPVFPVNTPSVLYPGLLLNTLWFYETQRDGPNYIPNALRTAPAHLNEENATVYDTPPFNTSDLITTTGTPLTSTGATINTSGGWYDAGDYMKYVETTSYALALMEIGIRDFPGQMGPEAPANPPAPPASVSYSGNASGAPASSDFSAEAQFGINWLEEMWNNNTQTLYYQVDNSQDWVNFSGYETEYDIWVLPQTADSYKSCTTDYYYICYQPVFIAAPAGSQISPNLAGRMAADFALYYQLYHNSNPTAANQALLYAEQIFALANTSLADPATSVADGTCASGCLTTVAPFDGYGETVWEDDMELGATELYIALQAGGSNLPSGLLVTNPTTYLTDAAQYAANYTTNIYSKGDEDMLNLYDVAGLAHFELYRALGLAGNPSGLALNQSTLLTDLKNLTGVAVTQAGTDVWGYGQAWSNGDTTSHGAGMSVMASEIYSLTGTSSYNTYSQRWLANILGANSWGSSFIIGAGSTFTNCPQHQIANLAGSLTGSSGGTPILWGAAAEGPAHKATTGTISGMKTCPANGVDVFSAFNGNDGAYKSAKNAVYKDFLVSYATTEPGIDLTATSFLMWSWRLAGNPQPLPSGQEPQTITCTTGPPFSEVYKGSFSVACSASSGLPVTYTSSGGCTNSGATYTMTSGTSACTVDVNQPGFSGYTAAPQVQYSVAATLATNAISFTTGAPASAAYDSSFNVAATASSGLKVAFTASGVCGVVDYGNGSATYTMTSGTGTCAVIANQAGNSNYNAAPQVTENVTATLAPNTVTLSGVPASAEYGSSFTVAASGLGSAAISYGSSGACTNSGATYTITAGSGTCTVTASQAADSNYAATSTPTSVSATDANGGVSVASGLNPSAYGQSVTFTATITSDTGAVKGHKAGKNGIKPADVTGTVTWSANTGCSASTVSGYPGASSCTTSSLAVGSDTVTANYSGDSNHNAGSGSVIQTVSQVSTTTAVASSLNPSEYGQAVSFSATVTGASPTGTVQFYINGSPFDTETLASGTATSVSTSALTAGTYTVTATYSGDTDNSGSTGTLAGGQVVNGSNSTTAVTSTPNPSTYATSVTFTATITTDTGDVKGRKPARKNGMNPMQPTGTVTWSANTGCAASTLSGSYPGVATCTTSSASHLPVGTDVVTASYSGDSNHTASSGSVNQVVTGGIATTIDVTSVSPASEEFGADTPVTITAVLSWTGHGVAPTASDVTIGGNGNGTYGATSCAARVHETITCTATYTPTTADVAGSYTETATFSGDTNYTASSSPESNNFAITGSNSTTTVTSTPNPSTYATSVTFTATITSDTGDVKGRKAGKKGMNPMQPTGTVTWSANTGCSASTLTGSYPGIATCTTSSATHLPVGTDVVTATYSGDSNHSGSSGSVNQVVTGGIATTIDVTSVSPSSEEFAADTPATITAVLAWTGHGVAPTAANVTIGGNGNGTYGATSCAARVHETITCTATYTPTNADVAGTYTETATFSGDTNYTASSSPETNNFTVGANATTTTVTSTPNPSTYATSVTFAATITSDTGDVKGRKPAKKNGMNPMQPTGMVTWGANTGCSPSTLTGTYPGVATCTTSSATHLPVGTDVVTATYSGDSNHSGSTGSVNQVVNGGIATTIDVFNVSPSSEEFAADTPVTITAVLSWTGHGVAPTASGVTISGNGNGTYGATSCAARVHETITCTTIYTPTSADVAGVYTETATFSGDANYSASSSPETDNFTITSNASTTSVSSGLNPSTYGGSVTFTATITSDTGDVKGRKAGKKNMQPMQPSGTVTWSANTGCAASTLSGAYPGVASCTTSSLGGGSDTVGATYSGDSSHGGSSGSVNQTVNPASQTITFTTAAPSSEPYNGTFGVAASASSSLTVAFTAAGSCSVVDNGNGTATYTMTSGAGTCTVKANQAGNANYSAAVQATKSVSATPASQTIVVTMPAPASAAKTYSFTVVAHTTSGLPITYTSAGICTNAGDVYTMTSNSGTCTVKLNAPSSANYTAAPQVVETTMGAAQVAPSVSLTGEPATANAGATFTVTASSNETGAVSIPVITTTTATICSVGANTMSGSSASATVTMLTGTGTCDLEATFAANYVYKAATVKEHTAGAKIVPTVTFTGAPATEAKGNSFTVMATSNESGNTVSVPTIAATPATVCTVGAVTSNGLGSYQASVTVVKATGTCTTKASWAANADYAAASKTLTTTAN